MVIHGFISSGLELLMDYPQKLDGLGTRIGYLTIVNMYMCPLVTTANMAGLCSRLFEGSVTKVYITHVVSRGVWGRAPPGNFVKLDARRWLLRPFLGPKSHLFHLSKHNFNSCYMYSL